MLRTTLVACACFACVPADAAPQQVPASLEQAVAAFSREDYQRAVALARIVADRTSGVERETARYIEGLACYRRGELDAAATSLRAAATSSDRFVSGQAAVTLGSVEIERAHLDAAGHAYRRAASMLDAPEARRAHQLAARCFEAAGLKAMADSERAAAGDLRSSDAPTATAEPRPASPAAGPVNATSKATVTDAGTAKAPSAASPPLPRRTVTQADKPKPPIAPIRFAIQAGAFSTRESAAKLADSLRAASRKAGFGEPRVIAVESADGRQLFVVQVGSFPTKAAATQNLGKLPKLPYVPVPWLSGSASESSD